MPDIRMVRKGRPDMVFYVISDGASAADMAECGATFACVSVDDWNRELSPWKAEKCFRNGEDFDGGAGEYLAELMRKLPEFEAAHGIAPVHRALCGYSLAGLCALYGLYVTDMFDGAASASGSMWFDGWLDFMEKNFPRKDRVNVSLSVGDRESRTRNPRLAPVEECTRKAREILEESGHNAVFELNPGNHFCEPERRLARAIDVLYAMYENNDSGENS